MTNTRADNITQLKKTDVLYADFRSDFAIHPITGTLIRLTNEQAISQSIINLVQTTYGERLFNQNIGGNIMKSLFEPNDLIAANELSYSIETTLRENEPRASIISVLAQPDNIDGSTMSVNIVYSIINSTQVQNLNLILRRAR